MYGLLLQDPTTPPHPARVDLWTRNLSRNLCSLVGVGHYNPSRTLRILGRIGDRGERLVPIRPIEEKKWNFRLGQVVLGKEVAVCLLIRGVCRCHGHHTGTVV